MPTQTACIISRFVFAPRRALVSLLAVHAELVLQIHDGHRLASLLVILRPLALRQRITAQRFACSYPLLFPRFAHLAQIHVLEFGARRAHRAGEALRSANATHQRKRMAHSDTHARAATRLVGVPGDRLAALAVKGGDGHELPRVVSRDRARHLCRRVSGVWRGRRWRWRAPSESA